MHISTERIVLTKRHPLTISRGTITGSVNVVVRVAHDGVEGLGEMAPSDVTGDTAESCEATITEWGRALTTVAPWELDAIERITGDTKLGSATRAALDLACHDWIGIDAADVIRTKVPEILHRTGARILKVKLGQRGGEDADREMFAIVQEAARGVGAEPTWRVDANGGWSVDVARSMIAWLAERGVDMIEQPLVQGAEDDLGALRDGPLPIYVDESVRVAADVVRLADRIDGVNLKLMKCGGIREGLRIIHTARAHGLRVMIGCMGESSLAIAAGAQLGGLVDALDLDSHLNLLDDPFAGMAIVAGRVAANDGPGLGVLRVGQDRCS